jgi:hypothetical protein
MSNLRASEYLMPRKVQIPPTGAFATIGGIRVYSRDRRTAIELFIAGIRGWEAGLRRQLENSKSN